VGEPAVEPVIEMAAAAAEPIAQEALLAPAAAAAAAASVGGLLRALSSERATQVHRGGPTIEDLVREEIRPLLKDWLDTHLPPMVERLVRAEIERVSGRVGP
jgi:cell pole-organizing protein PopZ